MICASTFSRKCQLRLFAYSFALRVGFVAPAARTGGRVCQLCRTCSLRDRDDRVIVVDPRTVSDGLHSNLRQRNISLCQARAFHLPHARARTVSGRAHGSGISHQQRRSVIRADIVRAVISRKPSAARPIESSSEESDARPAASKELRWAPHSEDEQSRARDRH